MRGGWGIGERVGRPAVAAAGRPVGGPPVGRRRSRRRSR
ncbi:hypothetical protein KPATCC21470_0404 [Kitasatospora purpeofusca]